MLKYVTRRRFNHIDALTVLLSATASAYGAWWYGIVVLVVGMALSIWAEVKVGLLP